MRVSSPVPLGDFIRDFLLPEVLLCSQRCREMASVQGEFGLGGGAWPVEADGGIDYFHELAGAFPVEDGGLQDGAGPHRSVVGFIRE